MSEYEFLWLEEIESKRSLAWVKEQNTESLNRLQNDPRYEELRTSAERLFTSDDRIPLVTHSNGMVHNFWQDTEHIKGIWRTTSMTSYTSENPDWQTILDIDALAEEEDEDWVYKGRVSLGPLDDRCMVMLSRGGSDATEMREFSISEEKFVMGGFFLKEAKSTVDWLDEDHLLVATDFGPGSLSTSGYPIIVKKWQRGTRISDATTIFTGDKSNMMVVPETRNRPEDRYPFLFRLFEFFQQEIYFLSADGLIRVPLPDDVVLVGVFQDLLICELRSDWQVKQQTFAAGSLVSVDMQASLDQGEPVNPELVFSPPSSYAIKNTSLGRDAVFISTLEDVDGALLEFRRGTNGWHETRVALPAKGSINIVVNDPVGDITMVNYESFLTPSTLYLLNQGAGPQAIKSMPDQFDASGYKSSQLFAESADGTRVPYYVVAPNDLPLDGSTPIYLYGYGGFENSLTTQYLTAMGIGWLKAGGALVYANIRGGGEYGPQWHQAALKENRQRAFDDYIAVAEDLIDRKITSPARLGIRGGSNGGLLVTTVMVQRPELYGAVICAVPLIDMMRYHRLSAGASWMAEYGNPDLPEEAAYISSYSPFQNVSQDADYPEIFLD